MGHSSLKMLRLVVIGSLALAAVSAQDTHYCPDGWVVSNVGEEIECVLLGGTNEYVTKADAEILCAAHNGWLVDLDEGHGGQKNGFIQDLIQEANGQNLPGRPGNNYADQWWIGATVTDPTGTITGATGPGTTMAKMSHGLTGWRESQMTGSVTSVVSPTSSPRISSGTATTNGTTGTVPRPPGTSARRPPSPQTPPSSAPTRPPTAYRRPIDVILPPLDVLLAAAVDVPQAPLDMQHEKFILFLPSIVVIFGNNIS